MTAVGDHGEKHAVLVVPRRCRQRLGVAGATRTSVAVMPEVADSRDRRKFSLTTFFTTAPMRRSKPARRYPPVTFGGLLARMFHDWDNSHGLILQGRWKPLRRQPPRGGRRRGIDDIEIAYRLGASGSRLHGQALYRTVRSATGAANNAFKPSSGDNPPQNW